MVEIDLSFIHETLNILNPVSSKINQPFYPRNLLLRPFMVLEPSNVV